MALIVLLVLTGRAHLAAQQPTLRLSLEDAVSRAMAASHRLAEARARESASRAFVSVRESAERPTIGATAGYTRTNHVDEFLLPGIGSPRVLYPDVPNNYQTRVELRWPVYTGGRTDALERAARAEAEAATSDVSVAQADLRLEVTRAYWGVVTANAAVSVFERGIARSQAHVAEVNQRLMAGLIPPNELASATAQEARARMLAIEARTQRDVAVAALARLIGVEPGQLIEPTAALASESAAPATTRLDVAPLVATAREHRQERLALQQRVTAAREQRVAAAAGRLPTIQVGGGVDYARPNPKIFPREEIWQRSWDVGAGLSWSLFDGGRTSAEVAQATAQAEAVVQRLAEFDSVLALEVRQGALELESAHAAVAAASTGVDAAAEARRVVEERFRAGVIAEIEVLDAEYALLQAELDRTRAQAGVRLAEAQLARALGQ
jgi:outer membrane protein TolC